MWHLLLHVTVEYSVCLIKKNILFVSMIPTPNDSGDGIYYKFLEFFLGDGGGVGWGNYHKFIFLALSNLEVHWIGWSDRKTIKVFWCFRAIWGC